MAEPTARETKLIQYLNEAYGKEKQLETVLQAQIKLAEKKQLKQRLNDHLKETKAQARGLQKRIKELGGKAEAMNVPGPDLTSSAAGAVASAANKALAAAKGPVQALLGTSPADSQLRNVRDSIWNEAEEIANYDTIEAFGELLGDKETVKLAKEYRRQEERMEKFLRGQIKSLAREVIKAEVPARERKPAGATTTRSRSASSRRRTASSSSSSTRRSTTASRSSGSSSSARKSTGTTRRSTSSRSRSGSGTSRSRSSS
jgi:ferritin-like metal-binding protein YciE